MRRGVLFSGFCLQGAVGGSVERRQGVSTNVFSHDILMVCYWYDVNFGVIITLSIWQQLFHKFFDIEMMSLWHCQPDNSLITVSRIWWHYWHDVNFGVRMEPVNMVALLSKYYWKCWNTKNGNNFKILFMICRFLWQNAYGREGLPGPVGLPGPQGEKGDEVSQGVCVVLKSQKFCFFNEMIHFDH